MNRRCDRNRKRSKRRAIYCPAHGCYMDSTSRKYRLFADRPEQLRDRGMKRLSALMLIQSCTAVSISGEWLEEFWCPECQAKTWYHVRIDNGSNHRSSQGSRRASYHLLPAPEQLWQQVSGVIQPGGNPSVSEYSRRSARSARYVGLKGFQLAQ